MHEPVFSVEADAEFSTTKFLKGAAPKGVFDDNYDWDVAAYPISKIAETRCERAVLKQVCFWYPKAKTVRHGYFWMIKSAQEFRECGVEYADDTIRRAIRRLKKDGVLVTERHFHPYRPVIGPVLWVRPGIPIFDDTKGMKKKQVTTFVTA